MSPWLKTALQDARDRDPIEMLNALENLNLLLRAHCHARIGLALPKLQPILLQLERIRFSRSRRMAAATGHLGHRPTPLDFDFFQTSKSRAGLARCRTRQKCDCRQNSFRSVAPRR
ncbi:MAG: hypothetical protein J0I92_16390, partial [Phyllobacterium sp.]|nr:hypothetical protein [Phyllobacterium sp.]